MDFATFESALKGDIVEPSSPNYAAAIARWSVNAERKARYIVFPKDDADVSLAVKFATENAIHLAIKGGGHNASGASSIEDGLCIDLSRYFDTTRVDPAQKLAYVGGGAIWSTVDRATIVHGLATPGGTVNHTGVGGLTLGGGYGWLSAAHGLVIDNLVQATVVIADGSVLTTSATSHPDLFWGIRGGGSNFGVVTEFVLKLHPQRKTVFAGPLIFPASVFGAVAEAVDNWWTAGTTEKESIIVSLTRGPGRQPVAFLTLFFNGSEEEGRANYKRFYDLGPISALAGEIPYENVNSLLNARVGHGRCYYINGTSLRSRLSPHADKILDRMVSLSTAPPDLELPPYDVLVGYEFISLKKVCEVPSDVTAFRSRGPQPNVVLLVAWDKEKAEGEGLAYARRSTKQLAAIVESTQERPLQENENEVYGNYVADLSDMPDRIRRLWGENYPRLQKIKNVYDPNTVFDRWFAIQPAA